MRMLSGATDIEKMIDWEVKIFIVALKLQLKLLFILILIVFLKDKENINIGITRAGNVIGGGDWAKDRIVADCMRAWSEDNKVEIRSPNSTRPWQHVLEPLSGYLHLASVLSENKNLNGEANLILDQMILKTGLYLN